MKYYLCLGKKTTLNQAAVLNYPGQNITWIKIKQSFSQLSKPVEGNGYGVKSSMKSNKIKLNFFQFVQEGGCAVFPEFLGYNSQVPASWLCQLGGLQEMYISSEWKRDKPYLCFLLHWCCPPKSIRCCKLKYKNRSNEPNWMFTSWAINTVQSCHEMEISSLGTDHLYLECFEVVKFKLLTKSCCFYLGAHCFLYMAYPMACLVLI